MTYDPSKKPFRLKAEEIVPLAEGRGSCIATDMITCEGRKVAFMYRQEPDRDIDSGWRFMSGYESDEYMDNNHPVSRRPDRQRVRTPGWRRWFRRSP